MFSYQLLNSGGIIIDSTKTKIMLRAIQAFLDSFHSFFVGTDNEVGVIHLVLKSGGNLEKSKTLKLFLYERAYCRGSFNDD